MHPALPNGPSSPESLLAQRLAQHLLQQRV